VIQLQRSSFVLTLLGAFSAAAYGQSSASLSGTVTDSSGTAVSGAKMVVHSIATGTDRAVTTDSAGIYVAP
jgi:hypothetical protein